MAQGHRTPTGVFVADDFRTNLVIDRYSPVFLSMRGSKTDAMRSENSEDVLTWNVFRSLAHIDPGIWFPLLFRRAFCRECPPAQMVGVDLWHRVPPPPNLRLYQKDEGESEVDVLIETETAVWFIEAKYRSDVSKGTTNNIERDQVLRNLDVGSWHAGVRDFYFSLLVVSDALSPVGCEWVGRYSSDRHELLRRLPHRQTDGLSNVKGIGVLRWSDCWKVLAESGATALHNDERITAARAVEWLRGKSIS